MSGDDQLFGADLGELHQIRMRALAVRFAFGAAISIVAGLGGQTLGSVVGGLLLAFPAILPASLTLIEKEDGTAAAVHEVGGAIFGATGLIAFAAVAAALLGVVSAPVALVAGLVAWVVVALSLYVLRAEERIPLPEPIRGRRPAGNR
ncbi:MAG TPA: DUF3147 family protein [Acidimicrobiales bacterium]|nr:DUF3147 family protein [Acidimicrobiales bacterium]